MRKKQVKKKDDAGVKALTDAEAVCAELKPLKDEYNPRELKLIYDSSVPAPFRKIIKPRMEAVKDFFPMWCERLTIYYDKDKEKTHDTVMECDPRHEYRTMSITVFPLFLEDSDGWYNAALHEIMHGLFRPYTAKTERVIEKFVKDEVVAEYLHEELAEAEECVAEDMAIFAEKLAMYWREQGKNKQS